MMIALLLALRRSSRRKATSEMFCTVPAGVTVLSNGDLADKTDLPDGRICWHYVLDLPFALSGDPGLRLVHRTHRPSPETGVDVYYYAPKGRRGRHPPQPGTNARDDRFLLPADRRPHPHRRYSQVFVHDFIFGGMETHATTLTSEASSTRARLTTT